MPLRARGWRSAAVAALALVIGAVLAWFARGQLSPPENPLAGAQFTRFTDFEGSELDAAISPDGKFVAFVSDRDGPFDIWVSQVGSSQFRNLTQGRVADPRAPVRSVGFSGDGSEIWLGDRKSV